MTNLTPDAVRVALAELLGYYPDPHPDGAWHGPGGRWLWRHDLPDPANDLNAMAAVEAALRGRGLGTAYLWHLVQAVNGRPPGGGAADTWEQRDNGSLLDVVTAPAAVRALAAYQVIVAATEAHHG